MPGGTGRPPGCSDDWEAGSTAVWGSVTNDLQVACEELNRRGCSARMGEVRDCPERELRLLVRHPAGRVAVELLAPLEEVRAERWHAVRVDQGRRTVWCEPARAHVVSGLDLVPFVQDVLSEPVPTVAVKYHRCDSMYDVVP